MGHRQGLTLVHLSFQRQHFSDKNSSGLAEKWTKVSPWKSGREADDEEGLILHGVLTVYMCPSYISSLTIKILQ
jgi:hypothetical protein